MSVSDIVDGMTGMLIDDGGADYIHLHQGLKVTMELLQYLEGLIIVILLIGIPVVVALEVLFLNFPIFQSSVTKLTEKDKRAQKIIGFCFRDAILAVTRANTAQTGKSANSEYLSIKIRTLFIAFFIIALAMGGINFIIPVLLQWIGKLLTMFL